MLHVAPRSSQGAYYTQKNLSHEFSSVHRDHPLLPSARHTSCHSTIVAWHGRRLSTTVMRHVDIVIMPV